MPFPDRLWKRVFLMEDIMKGKGGMGVRGGTSGNVTRKTKPTGREPVSGGSRVGKGHGPARPARSKGGGKKMLTG